MQVFLIQVLRLKDKSQLSQAITHVQLMHVITSYFVQKIISYYLAKTLQNSIKQYVSAGKKKKKTIASI